MPNFSANSFNRVEFDEFFEPTTTITSTCSAKIRTAS
ncbi:Uncharacterised protein [Vibrio cholerae]|nr:Uncharacterised protein [Vibrio cholerae]